MAAFGVMFGAEQSRAEQSSRAAEAGGGGVEEFGRAHRWLEEGAARVPYPPITPA